MAYALRLGFSPRTPAYNRAGLQSHHLLEKEW